MSGSDPTAYGLLPQGFVRMRLPEIKQQIQTNIEIATGKKWHFGEDSFIGLLVSIFAEREAAMWELAEAVHLSMYPSGAIGTSLDNAVAFSGVRRKFDTPTLALALVFGTPGTTVPAGSSARTAPQDGTTQKSFTLQQDVTISESRAASATYELQSVPFGTEYSITINGVKHSWVAASTNAADAATALVGVLEVAGFDVVVSGARFTLAAPIGTTFGLIPSANLTLIALAGVGIFASDVLGPVPLVANELTTIATDVIGWSRVTNPVEGEIGALAEEDFLVRARYPRGVYQLGGGSTSAIQANLERNVVGVESAQVYENVLDVSDAEGRPPHSIEVVIQGGLDQEVANEIYRVKGGGIATFGSVQMQVKGSTGTLVPINYNRPAPVFIWVIIDLSLYPEEILEAGATIDIRQVVADAINALPTGKDVITQRLLGPIFAASAGIARASIRTAAVPTAGLEPSPASYNVNDVAISPRQRAKSAPELIQVNII